MSKLVQFETEKGTILIESAVSEQTGRIEPAGGIEDLKKRLPELLQIITPIAEGIIKAKDSLSSKPDGVSAKFGLSLTAEGNIFVVKASAEATLKVAFTWGKP